MSVASLSSSTYVSNTTSGGFTINGLGDGTDWTSLIDATVEAESYKKDQYEADLEDAESAVTLLTALDEELLELSTTLQGIDEMDEFISYSASISGDEVTATLENGAEEGSYNLVVNQLAKKMSGLRKGMISLPQTLQLLQLIPVLLFRMVVKI